MRSIPGRAGDPEVKMQRFDRSNVSAIAYQDSTLPLVAGLSAVTVAIPMAGYHSLVTGTAQAALAVAPADPAHGLPAMSLLTLAAGASSTTDAYRGLAIRITAGTGTGARGTVTAYNGTTKVASVSWGTGQSGSAGVPAALDSTSVYELSIDCFNRGKVIVKTEYGNASCTAGISVALRDANGLVLDTAVQTPANLGQTDKATVGYRARSFEVPTDGMDTAFLQVETAAAGGVSPSVTAWGAAV